MDDCYLVIYDIADNRRLARAAAIVLDYGVRVQRSVYEVRLSPRTLAILQRRLGELIDPEADSVKIIPLCGRCAGRRQAFGADLPEMGESSPWIVV